MAGLHRLGSVYLNHLTIMEEKHLFTFAVYENEVGYRTETTPAIMDIETAKVAAVILAQTARNLERVVKLLMNLEAASAHDQALNQILRDAGIKPFGEV